MTEDTVDLRLVTEADRTRIVEISSQIWDGHDYVPELLDEWLADAAGEVVGAVIEDELVGFARRTWLAPGLAWLEGIRTDPAYRGRGIGRAITEYLIDRARAAGAIRISLSTYIDSEASIHIIKSYGFERVAMFVYRERPADAPSLDPDAGADPQIAPVSEEETVEYVSNSSFLRLASRRFPRGWRFFPFDHDPRAAVARMACASAGAKTVLSKPSSASGGSRASRITPCSISSTEIPRRCGRSSGTRSVCTQA